MMNTNNNMTSTSSSNQQGKLHPLSAHSLRGMSHELDEKTDAAVRILGSIALKGQATVIYAAPNTGKTLLALSMICSGVDNKSINHDRLYYINVDDSASGLVEKAHIADTHGFHMLAEGHEGFEAGQFPAKVDEIIQSGHAPETVVVLDTLKKFTNLMDKSKVTTFTSMVRRFVMNGGTLIALAHVNKSRGSDGKVVYGGTSDVVDDFDCAYTLTEVPGKSDTSQKVVVFENIKQRGDVAKTVGYAYLNITGSSYVDILESVKEVDLEKLIPRMQAAERYLDFDAIQFIKGAIVRGLKLKMMLAEEVCKSQKMSRRAALAVIDRYTGNDVTKHLWTFKVVDRGGKEFALLEGSTYQPPTESDDW